MRFFFSIAATTAFIATSAQAQPSATGGWNGTNAYILSNTASSPKWRCVYAMSVALSDGTTVTANGTTDPPVGMTNSRVVTRSFNKNVTHVNVTQWDCSQIP